MIEFKNVLTAFVPDLTGFRKFFGIFPKECKIKSLEALDKVDMLEKAYVRVDQLSGGQQQRVAIARALVSEAPVILADEPTGNLDEATAGEIIDVLKKLAKERNKCVIVVTHSKEVASAADIILELNNKKLKEVKKSN